MLFVTNHSKKDGRESQVGEKFVFEHGDEEVGQHIYFCDDREGDQTEVGSTDLLSSLKDSQAEELLIYFHGFNVQPNSALEHGRKCRNFSTRILIKLK